MKRLRWRAEWAWLAAVAALLVLGYRWFPTQDGSMLDTFSTAAGGKRAFFTVVERLIPPATRAMEDIYDHTEFASTICILGPARYPESGEWRALADWVIEGNSLVFAARQSDPAVDLKYFGIRVVPNERIVKSSKPDGNQPDRSDGSPDESLDGSENDQTEPGTPGRTSDSDSAKPVPRRRRDIFSEPDVHTPLAGGTFHWQSSGRVEPAGKGADVLVSWDGFPQVVRKRFGDGTLIVCSSDYVFSNKSLATDDNGLLAFRILEAAAPNGVVFDESLNASGTQKVFGLLFDPHVRPITLQIIVVLVLFGWYGFRRFGSVQVDASSEHRSMAEHAVALGNLHLKSSTGGRALSWYLEYFRNELRLHYAPGAAASEATLLARRAGVDEKLTARLLSEARQAVHQERVSGSRVAAIVRELAAIKNKLDHAKGA